MVERNLRPASPLIAPSMLKCDFSNLEREAHALEKAGAQLLHLDVMDGHFVPNLSYGALVIESYRPCTNLVFEAHLMISDPAKYLDDYIRAGCDWITFHIEAVSDPLPLLRRIRDAGRLAGIALNPDTPVSAISQCAGECDLVLVMTVHPGFGGQAFIPSSTDKVKEVRELFSSDTLVSVDGGIGPKTIGAVSAAGAEVFVAGSSIFGQPCYQTAIQEMERLAREARTAPAGL
ncbi:ribulose-phosphate 3-epimerase [Planctomicrobium sp. SH664]|uniref:ribulose-phosphate 3-epimerase n=1 Tax=Planctomicrobium sp. SH664 TaxID=3448125 RepID=UPI003F5C7109